MKNKTNYKRFLFLAKLGIIESTNEKGEDDVQRIDDTIMFAIENNLSFYPERLENDEEAKKIFSELTPEQLKELV